MNDCLNDEIKVLKFEKHELLNRIEYFENENENLKSQLDKLIEYFNTTQKYFDKTNTIDEYITRLKNRIKDINNRFHHLIEIEIENKIDDYMELDIQSLQNRINKLDKKLDGINGAFGYRTLYYFGNTAKYLNKLFEIKKCINELENDVDEFININYSDDEEL